MRKYLNLIFIPILSSIMMSCGAPYFRSGEVTREDMYKRQEIVECAKGLVGTKDLTALNKCFKNDCSGFVIGVYRLMGYRLPLKSRRSKRTTSELLYLSLEDKGMAYRDYEPIAGDAVFFKNTTDVIYDRITHMGLVEEVYPDGTVSIIHYSSGTVNRIRMNLKDPYRGKNRNGEVINNYLKRDDAGAGKRNILAGALFQSYGDIYNYCQKIKR